MAELVITLLHGTFAKNATWVDDAGSIAGALVRRFGDRVAIERLRWSGANSYEGRREAAQRLCRHITQPAPGRSEGARHIVVAHSHAGNIVAYAAREPAVDARLAGVVTLATPFIVARARNLGHVGGLISQAMVVWLVLGLYALAAAWLGPRFGSAPSGELPVGAKLALIVSLAVLVEVPGLLLAARWRRSAMVLLDDLALASLGEDRLLILRAMADEASAAITFLQFPSVASTVLFGRLAGAADAIVSGCERLARRPLLAVGAYVVLLLASMVPAGLVMWATGSELLMYAVLILCMCASYGPLVFMMLRNRHLAYVTAAGFLAVPLVPVLLLLSLAASLAYGRRFALTNLALDVGVEPTPIGTHRMTLLSPSAAADPDRPGGLLHSALYDDPRAIELICDFVQARLAPPASATGAAA